MSMVEVIAAGKPPMTLVISAYCMQQANHSGDTNLSILTSIKIPVMYSRASEMIFAQGHTTTTVYHESNPQRSTPQRFARA